MDPVLLEPFVRGIGEDRRCSSTSRRMLVPAGDVIAAGAALAHLDLALRILRLHSPSMASLFARYLMIDERPSQAALVISDYWRTPTC